MVKRFPETITIPWTKIDLLEESTGRAQTKLGGAPYRFSSNAALSNSVVDLDGSRGRDISTCSFWGGSAPGLLGTPTGSRWIPLSFFCDEGLAVMKDRIRTSGTSVICLKPIFPLSNVFCLILILSSSAS
jgi:hypothetical protein